MSLFRIIQDLRTISNEKMRIPETTTMVYGPDGVKAGAIRITFLKIKGDSSRVRASDFVVKGCYDDKSTVASLTTPRLGRLLAYNSNSNFYSYH